MNQASSTQRRRPLVAIVTKHWGDAQEEATVLTRLVAGALARRADVEVLHLVAPGLAGEPVNDSVFRVHRLALQGARPMSAAIVRATLAQASTAKRLPTSLAAHLTTLEGHAGSVRSTLELLAPDTVLLAGSSQPFELAALGERDTPGRARVVLLPLCSDLHEIGEPGLARLVEVADAIGAANPGERSGLIAEFAEREQDIFSLNLGLNVNYSATTQGLFGVRFFGRFVLLLRSFPPGGPRYTHSLSHELLRSILGNVSVAEVDGDKWRIADRENTLELPVSPTRVNLWRLMAHAQFTVDLRPQGPLGREALESMLLGTPVIVPEDSSAGAHVRAASGGLWYRDTGELLDSARLLMDETFRAPFAYQAQTYARAVHGDLASFVDTTAVVVLGKKATLSA